VLFKEFILFLDLLPDVLKVLHNAFLGLHTILKCGSHRVAMLL
jgi:hypothetical protein